MPVPRLAFIVLVAACLPAQAAIYKYVDDDGNVTLTDKYRPGAVKLMDTQDDQPPATARTPRAHRAAPKPSPANFPKVDSATQQQRDDIRRTVLLEERGKEAQNLEAARAALNAPGKRSQAELDILQNKMSRHQKNIEMLDKELAGIK